MLRDLYNNSTPYDEWMIPVPRWIRRLEYVTILAYFSAVVAGSSSIAVVPKFGGETAAFTVWWITLIALLGFAYMVWWKWVSCSGSANLQYHYTTTITMFAAMIVAPLSTVLSFDFTMPCGCFSGLGVLAIIGVLWD